MKSKVQKAKEKAIKLKKKLERKKFKNTEKEYKSFKRKILIQLSYGCDYLRIEIMPEYLSFYNLVQRLNNDSDLSELIFDYDYLSVYPFISWKNRSKTKDIPGDNNE